RKYGDEISAKVARFVIITPMEDHCICLPISTYSGQGVNKTGVHAENHAIIYSGKNPVALRGEKDKGLRMRSIRVEPETPRHKLDDASRLNYAKTYTIEYNAKVWFIGKVHKSSQWQLRADFDNFQASASDQGLAEEDDSTEDFNTQNAVSDRASVYPTF
ncbi:hypothetical protein N431DRAFT_349432, partial [Stipitochalara longipes BDJ]